MADRISDFEINNLVRKELVIMRVDTNKLKYGTSAGSVYISGELFMQGGNKGERETAKFIKDLEGKIQEIKGVRSVLVEIKGWERTPGGQWVPAKGGGGAKGGPKVDVPQTKAAPPKAKIEPITIHNITSSQTSCPHCSRALTSGVKFCEDCGEKLKLEQLIKDASKCVKCGHVTRGKQKFCGECGGNTKPTEERTIIATCMKCGFMKHRSFKFCGECGKSVLEAKSEKAASKTSWNQTDPEAPPDKMDMELSELAQKAKTHIDLSDDDDDGGDDKKTRILQMLNKDRPVGS